jgi:galactose oxidase
MGLLGFGTLSTNRLGKHRLPVLSRLLVASGVVVAASGLVASDSWTGAAPAGHHHGHGMVEPPAFIPVASDPTLPRAGWAVTADSQEPTYPATAAIDGSTATMWHTRWTPAPPDPLPHTLTIDTNATNTITALRYQPRTDSSRNGTIGAYQIHTSPTGTAWTLAASGTLPDTNTEKTIPITPTTTRFVRLTATTEAGNRGQWTSAAEINLVGVPPGTSPHTHGTWGAIIGFPLVPAAAALLPGNRLLTWSAFEPFTFSGGGGRTVTATMNLVDGTVSQRTVTETGHDMFCPGTARLPDGGVMVTGGNNSNRTSTFQQAADTWTTGPTMNIPRGYQSMVTLSDGRVFTIGGSWSGGQGGKHGEVWAAATGWQRLPGAPVDPILTADPGGVYRADNHIWLFAAPDGRVFHAGPSRQMNWYDTTGSGSHTAAGTRGDDTDAMNGNAVMYDVGKILTVGGATAYQNADASNRAYVIDVNGTVTARRVGSMAHARAFANSVVLPDGKVVVVGGQSYPVPFSDATAVLAAELWDPATEQFTAMASMAVPRTYHSVAALLPDGRVFSGGGGLCGNCATNHPDGQIFTPPYLYAADGTPAVRPVITTAPAAATPGATISVTTDRTVTGFSLVRAGSTTHTVDTDQRRVPLTASGATGTTYTIPLPASTGVLVPGHYMLFALDANGVPSVSTQMMIS